MAQSDRSIDSSRPVVVVTGSSGYIGYALCERFAGRAVVIGLDRPGEPHPPPSAHCVDIDLTSDESVRDALESVRRLYGNRIAAVFHLAAFYSFSMGGDHPMYRRLTVDGTARLLRYLREFEVGSFIFSSTMLVHAPGRSGERITEGSPIKPRWAYPASKVAAEEKIRREKGRMPAVLWRVSGVYDDECHSIPLAHQFQRIFERQWNSYFFAGDPDHGQSFVHRDDLLDLAEALYDRRATLPPLLDLLAGEPQTLSYRDLQRKIGLLLHGRPWPVIRLPKPIAKLGSAIQNLLPFGRKPFIKPWMIDLADDHYDLDISRATELTGWKPKRNLESALVPMAAALVRDPVAFYQANELEPPSWLEEWKRTRTAALAKARIRERDRVPANRR